MTDQIRLERIAPGAAREAFVPLLLLADEPEPLRGYLHQGNLYVWRAADGEPLGVTQVLPVAGEPGARELKAVAIAAHRQQQGLGRQMLTAVLDELRRRGTARAIVGTSNAGIGEIAFYQKAGFRLWRIERDYFTPERGYDPEERHHGLPHRDMVWFDRDLTS